jgi:ParB/RepB/Spo0J family partition protein
MQNALLSNQIANVELESIRPSADNPRGVVQRGSTFDRLVSSVRDVGILVPLVVQKLRKPDRGILYELVDGERRFLAAQVLRLERVPAHIVEADVGNEDLRRFMFHLHMTREQWEPLAQVKSLGEMYPETARGISIKDKPIWAKKIAAEARMSPGTARDRVHLLSWPEDLKTQILNYSDEHPEFDVYSYILALEASIVDPAARTLPQQAKRIEGARKILLEKLLEGIEDGSITSRDQIRQIGPLFSTPLTEKEQKTAKPILEKLISKGDFSFDDAKAEVEIKLPHLLAEKPAKPRKVVAMIRTLSDVLGGYKVEYLRNSVKGEAKLRVLKSDFRQGLATLMTNARSFRSQLRDGD